jgi:hypothetical protein
VLVLSLAVVPARSAPAVSDQGPGGINVERFPDGRAKSTTYAGGTGKGTRRDFYESGAMKADRVMDQGVLIVEREWHADGRPKRVTLYKEGTPYFTKEWDARGTLRVRPGAQYREVPLPKNVSDYIAASFPASEKSRRAVTQFAKAMELKISESNDRAKSIANVLLVSAGLDACTTSSGCPSRKRR